MLSLNEKTVRVFYNVLLITVRLHFTYYRAITTLMYDIQVSFRSRQRYNRNNVYNLKRNKTRGINAYNLLFLIKIAVLGFFFHLTSFYLITFLQLQLLQLVRILCVPRFFHLLSTKKTNKLYTISLRIKLVAKQIVFLSRLVKLNSRWNKTISRLLCTTLILPGLRFTLRNTCLEKYTPLYYNNLQFKNITTTPSAIGFTLFVRVFRRINLL